MIHSIENDFIKVQVKEFGAELCSIQKKNDTVEYLWQADKNYWNRHSPILFPIVGKLLDDEYIYNNKTYKMTQHGFARDQLFKLHSKKDDEIVFSLNETTETLKIYPFKFELLISYRLLKNTLEIGYKVVNHTLDKMFFSIGAHPAFNWPLSNQEDKENYYLEFTDTKELERLPLTPLGISSNKEIISLVNNRLSLNETMFIDDALVIENLNNKSIVLKSTENKRKIEVSFENFPFVGIWSKPQGSPFVCIEPWCGIADGIEHDKNFEDKKGIITLEKDGIFQSNYQISIE
ncbi:aldose 1-epimerase family protein [Arcobacteraceae bacterium]|nr:aldose 1-epimerase family protein [Arcobacteraceae bacterium]